MATNRQVGQQALQIRRRQSRRQRSSIISAPDSTSQQPTEAVTLYRHLAQQARQLRRLQSIQQSIVPIARRPLFDQSIAVRHTLSQYNIFCSFCQAQHWIEERIQGSTISSPRFSACCERGAIALDKFEDPPEPLYSLLTGSNSGTSNIFVSHG